jgi:hypothetical protein
MTLRVKELSRSKEDEQVMEEFKKAKVLKVLHRGATPL